MNVKQEQTTGFSPSAMSSMPNNTYPYQLKPVRGKKLRLLHLYQVCGVICYRMEVHRLSRAPDYIAISYAWGSILDTATILVDETNITITTSLSGALKAIGRKGMPIWADAVCIDQQNNEEKEEQIRLMQLIYKKANSVSIWLGPEEGCGHGLDFLVKLNRAPLAIMQISELEMRDMARLFLRAYWERIWVVQEVQCAPVTSVHCGNSTHSLEIYKLVNSLAVEHEDFLNERFRNLMDPSTQARLSNTLARFGPARLDDAVDNSRHGSQALLYKLSFHRDKNASDPRDKVYGILGLLDSPLLNDKRVGPDYCRPASVLFTNVVKYSIEEARRLDVICEASFKSPSPSILNLPSWAPDWSWRRSTRSLAFSYNFNAGGEEASELTTISEDGLELTILAARLGRIQDVGLPVAERASTRDILQSFHRGLAMLVSRDGGPVPELTLQSFCRTLCLDQAPMESRGRDWTDICAKAFLRMHTRDFQVSFTSDFVSSMTQRRMEEDELMEEEVDDDELMEKEYEPTAWMISDTQVVREECGERMKGFNLCMIDFDLIGMGTAQMTQGDEVVIAEGCSVPLVIRQHAVKPCRWQLIGEIYVDGVMQGEVMKEVKRGAREPLSSYTLV